MLESYTLHDVRPARLFEPTTADEAAAILREANEKEWRVECAGAGTQAYGNRRTRADAVITTRKLDGVVEYDAADLVIGAQAGMTLRDLRARTARNSQILALDPPSHPDATIGGMIAAARSGPARYAYGTPRDHVLGLQVVTGDGRIMQLGGRVVKNVAGYDLVRLFVGSAGTLGLITSAYLRLRPIPQSEAIVICFADSAAPLLDIARVIMDENLEATAIELASPGTLGDKWALVVRLGGNQEAVADASARLNTVDSFEQAHDAFERIAQAEVSATTIVRLADVPSRIAETLALAGSLRNRAGHAGIIAHAGDGIVRVLIGETDVEATAFAIGEARRLLKASGGTVTVQSGSGELMRRVDAFGMATSTLPLMQKLKQAFDPGGVLAPGRFVL